MNKTLELLKPPFDFGVARDSSRIIICDSRNNRILFETYIRGGYADQRLIDITQFAVDALNEKIEREKNACENAGKTEGGKCTGYQVSETNDEPCNRCKECKDSQFYED